MDEFDIIDSWFNCSALHPHNRSIIVHNGDDGAAITIPPDHYLVQSMDTYVAEKHFPEKAPAHLIAYRTLAASVSDLAAMGAQPHSLFLSLSLPTFCSSWMENFHRGLKECLQAFNMVLLGGDIVKGPCVLTFHVQGWSKKKLLQRSSAVIGDDIYVSGTLGDAGGALPMVLEGVLPETVEKELVPLIHAYYYPQPQIELGQWLINQGVKAAIDISDGLLQDINHLLSASCVGACIHRHDLPLSNALLSLYSKEKAQSLALTAGDDYQLCFCWPANKKIPNNCPCQITKIGKITKKLGLVNEHQEPYTVMGFKHF